MTQILYSTQPISITLEEPINFCWVCGERLRYEWKWNQEALMHHISDALNTIVQGMVPGYWQELPCKQCVQAHKETEEYAKLCDTMQKELEHN